MNWIVNSLQELKNISKEIVEHMEEPIILFKGEMGAGKTTLIKILCEEMGIQEEVNSPTFSIVNEYQRGNGEMLYHFDFYRIEDEEEAYDFGYEEYFFSGHCCLVEWPEKIANLLPSNFGLLEINKINEERHISFLPTTSNFPV